MNHREFLKFEIGRYALTVIAVVLATVARALLDPILGDHLPYPTFFGAVIFAAWIGGLRPALLATLLGLCVTWLAFVPPRWSFVLQGPEHALGLALFVFVSLAFAGFGEAMRVARSRAEQAEYLAREQAEKLRVTFASMGDAVITTDPLGNITYLNGVAQTLTGWTVEEATGKSLAAVFRIINEDSRQPVENPVDKVLREGRVVGLANHTLLIAKDGRESPIDDSAAPIRDQLGNLVGVILIFHDITERKRADQERRTAQLETAATLESMMEGFNRFDRDWRFVYVNAQGERLLGSKREDLLGKVVWDEYPAITGTPLGDAYRRAVAENVPLELENYYEPWSRWFAVKMYPAADGGLCVFFHDITERKRWAETLQAGEQRLRLAQQIAKIGTFEWNIQTGVNIWTPELEAMYGLPPGGFAGSHEAWEKLIHPDDLSHASERVRAAIEHGEFSDEWRVVWPDGSIRWLAGRGHVFKDEGGRPLRLVGVNIDVTDRKHTEEALRRQTIMLRGISDGTTDLIYVKDRESRLIFANPTTLAVIGLSADEIVGKHEAERYTDPAEAEAIMANDRRIMETGTAEVVEEVFTGPSGTRIYLSTKSPMKDERAAVTGLIGISRDITDRKRHEEALQHSEARYRAIGEAIDFGIWMCDAEGRNTYASDSFLRLVGLTQEQCSDFGWGEILHPEDAQQTIAEWKDCVRSGGVWDREHRFKGVDGQWHHILARGVPLNDEQGRVLGWVGINLDIGRLKQAEEALRDADRRKDEFLATLAHELRNPLAPVRNAVQLLHLKGPAVPELQWAREVIDRQMQAMTRLIDDLMDVSRISRNKLELRRERILLETVLQGAIETSRPLIEQQRHELEVTLPAEPLTLDADLTRLAQVFLNLLNNAAKYTEPGGRIQVVAERQGSDVVVTVEDSGLGISPDKLPNIFEMFSQLEGSLSRSQGGLGIGLCLVKRLVEMHGGSVEAHSEGPGTGSRFVVRLPLVVERVQAGSPPTPEDTITNSKLRILVVDDNKDAAATISMVLKILGNTVRQAHDGEEAVLAAAEFQPQVILLDIGLPKLNGYEVCRKIREQSGGKSIVIIAVTGWGQEDDRRKSNEAGFDRHLVKPVNPQALMKILGELSPFGLSTATGQLEGESRSS